MNDEKLLIFAAKAAGMPPPVDAHGVWSAWVGSPEGGHWWDPLTDDGDALRLAVKLNIHISLYGPDTGITAWIVKDSAHHFDADYGDDPCASVRRAIVRAAAEIGREML